MKKLRFVAMVCVMSLLLGSLGMLTVFADGTDEGMTFTAENTYQTEVPLNALPTTLEATVFFPKSMGTERGGTILGNYESSKSECISFEVYKNGQPRLYLIDNDGGIYNIVFDQINVYTGEWTHIAIVTDAAASKAFCYINGVLAQTMNVSLPKTITFFNVMRIGGDLRTSNVQYFKGSIKNIAIYSDIRTDREIKADSTGTYTADDAALIGFYDLTGKGEVFSDANGQDPDFIYDSPFLTNYNSVTDYAYSFAVIGDIQTLTCYYPEKLHFIYDWIAENAEEKNIRFAFGLGDITDKNTDAEYQLAKAEMSKLDGIVPYSVIRGNHDKVAGYKKNFPYSNSVSGSYSGDMLNTFQRITVGEIKYLIINLDIGPSDSVLNWASQLCEKYYDHNVIVTTHIHLQKDGTTFDEGEGYTALKYGGINTGEEVWSKFLSKHENIVLVLSGHDPTDKIVVTEKQGDHGNKVVQMLVDPQTTDKNYDGVGMVAMLYFSEDGSQVSVEYYSTIKDAHFLEENQFSLEFNVVQTQTSADPESSIVTGNRWYTGEGAPVAAANNGDLYLDTVTCDIYQFDTVWTLVANIKGSNGASFDTSDQFNTTGTEAPDAKAQSTGGSAVGVVALVMVILLLVSNAFFAVIYIRDKNRSYPS